MHDLVLCLYFIHQPSISYCSLAELNNWDMIVKPKTRWPEMQAMVFLKHSFVKQWKSQLLSPIWRTVHHSTLFHLCYQGLNNCPHKRKSHFASAMNIFFLKSPPSTAHLLLTVLSFPAACFCFLRFVAKMKRFSFKRCYFNFKTVCKSFLMVQFTLERV